MVSALQIPDYLADKFHRLAYDDTMKIMVIAATLLSVPPVLFSLLMPNWYLVDQQNAVDAPPPDDDDEGDDVEDEDEEYRAR